ncbi:MAG TPA: enoyl-CoA hydratase/isomerase family protein, partial [Mycobacterium sp.]
MGESANGCVEVTYPCDKVAQVTLSRPELLNRVDQELHIALPAVLNEIAQDRSVRAVVLASTGKVFSAGGDFELLHRAYADGAERQAIIDDGRRLLNALLSIPQPVVAAMQGAAIGVGATMVLLCDAVVAARTASIADTHVAIGLVAGDGGALAWPQSAGMLRARRYLLTGDPLDAATAYDFGLVTDLVDSPEAVVPAALELAARIARRAPLAVQGTKQALNRLAAQRAGEVVDLSLALESQTLASEDLLEGISA